MLNFLGRSALPQMLQVLQQQTWTVWAGCGGLAAGQFQNFRSGMAPRLQAVVYHVDRYITFRVPLDRVHAFSHAQRFQKTGLQVSRPRVCTAGASTERMAILSLVRATYCKPLETHGDTRPCTPKPILRHPQTQETTSCANTRNSKTCS